MWFKRRGIPALSHCCNSFTCVTVFTTNNSAALGNAECLQSARQYWSMDSNVNKMIFLSVTVICFHIVHRFTNYHHHEWEMNLWATFMNGEAQADPDRFRQSPWLSHLQPWDGSLVKWQSWWFQAAKREKRKKKGQVTKGHFFFLMCVFKREQLVRSPSPSGWF